MIQFVNEREEKKESLFESSFSRLGKVCKILLVFKKATGLITSIHKLYNYRLMARGLVKMRGVPPHPNSLDEFFNQTISVHSYQLSNFLDYIKC